MTIYEKREMKVESSKAKAVEASVGIISKCLRKAVGLFSNQSDIHLVYEPPCLEM